MQFLNKNVKGRQEVGHIDLLQKFSYIEVPEQDADKVMAALNGVSYKGREVRCNDADEGGHGGASRSDRGGARGGRASRSPFGKPSHVAGYDRSERRSRRRDDDEWAPKGGRAGKDDWKELIQGKPFKFKGEQPDFSEEGWARRRPKKK